MIKGKRKACINEALDTQKKTRNMPSIKATLRNPEDIKA